MIAFEKNSSAYDGPHYNLLGNRTLGIVLGEPNAPVIPISLSERGWELITPVLKRKKAAERSAALGADVEELHRHYHVPGSNTAVGHLVLRPTETKG